MLTSFVVAVQICRLLPSGSVSTFFCRMYPRKTLTKFVLLYCSSTLTLGILLSMYSGNIPLQTLRGNTLLCAPVPTFTRIQGVLRECIGNYTLMCVSASSCDTVLTVTGLKFSSLGSSQGGDGLSIMCTLLACCLVVGGCRLRRWFGSISLIFMMV